MHDAKGRQLTEGDIVLIPAKITHLDPGEDYCNAYVETLYGRRPDGAKERFNAFNTAVLLRANEGDQNDVQIPVDGGTVLVLGNTIKVNMLGPGGSGTDTKPK